MRALERRDKILELLCEKRFLKTADLWERSPKNNRLHFHGIFYIPEGEMIGELEEVEGYTNRQNDFVHHEAPAVAKAVADIGEDIKDSKLRTEDVVDDIREEIGILEIAKQPKIDDHAQREPPSRFSPLAFKFSVFTFHLIYTVGNEPVAEGDEDEYEQE